METIPGKSQVRLVTVTYLARLCLALARVAAVGVGAVAERAGLAVVRFRLPRVLAAGRLWRTRAEARCTQTTGELLKVHGIRWQDGRNTQIKEVSRRGRKNCP